MSRMQRSFSPTWRPYAGLFIQPTVGGPVAADIHNLPPGRPDDYDGKCGATGHVYLHFDRRGSDCARCRRHRQSRLQAQHEWNNAHSLHRASQPRDLSRVGRRRGGHRQVICSCMGSRSDAHWNSQRRADRNVAIGQAHLYPRAGRTTISGARRFLCQRRYRILHPSRRDA